MLRRKLIQNVLCIKETSYIYLEFAGHERDEVLLPQMQLEKHKQLLFFPFFLILYFLLLFQKGENRRVLKFLGPLV